MSPGGGGVVVEIPLQQSSVAVSVTGVLLPDGVMHTTRNVQTKTNVPVYPHVHPLHQPCEHGKGESRV